MKVSVPLFCSVSLNDCTTIRLINISQRSVIDSIRRKKLDIREIKIHGTYKMRRRSASVDLKLTF